MWVGRRCSLRTKADNENSVGSRFPFFKARGPKVAIMARELGCSIEEIGRRPWPASSMLSQRWIDEEEREKLRDLSDPSRVYKLHGAA